MKMHLNETQEMLQDGARRFFSSEFGSEKIRTIEGGVDGFSPENWRQITELGWSAVALPESAGGSGLGILELCVLVEEMGRAGASSPLIVNSGLSATILHHLSSNTTASELLTLLATSDSVISTALIDESGRDERSPSSLLLDENNLTLSGVKQLVPYASIANVLLVSASSSAGEPLIVAVDTGIEGISTTRHRTLGGDPLFQVKFDEVAVTADRILARGTAASEALDTALDIATVLALAEAVGNCEGILHLTAEHAKIREQFGTAIGSFQAVSHPIADMRIQTDAMRMLTLEAAWLLDRGESASFEIASAKVYANEAVAKIALDGHRLHGAIGYSNEYDLQLYTRRAKAFTVTWGDTDREVERAAAALGI